MNMQRGSAPPPLLLDTQRTKQGASWTCSRPYVSESLLTQASNLSRAQVPRDPRLEGGEVFDESGSGEQEPASK